MSGRNDALNSYSSSIECRLEILQAISYSWRNNVWTGSTTNKASVFRTSSSNNTNAVKNCGSIYLIAEIFIPSDTKISKEVLIGNKRGKTKSTEHKLDNPWTLFARHQEEIGGYTLSPSGGGIKWQIYREICEQAINSFLRALLYLWTNVLWPAFSFDRKSSNHSVRWSK